MSADSPELEAEAVLFGTYLIGSAPGQGCVERYVAACRQLFTSPVSARDEALLGFCARHPRSVAFLDAAAGLFAGESLLRHKILLMASLLEATPEHSRAFLPQTTSAPRFVLRAAGVAFVAAFEAAAGSVLFVLAGGLRR